MSGHISVKAHCIQTFHVHFIYKYLLTASSISSSPFFSFPSSLTLLLACFVIEKILYLSHHLIQKFGSASKTKNNLYPSCLTIYNICLCYISVHNLLILCNISQTVTNLLHMNIGCFIPRLNFTILQ